MFGEVLGQQTIVVRLQLGRHAGQLVEQLIGPLAGERLGLDLMLSTLFESYELGARNETRELVDLLATRTPRELVLATRVLRTLFDEIDGIAAEAASEDQL